MNSTLRTKLMARMMKNAKGFTLIELLVVIVIVGVLSAVAVPTFLNQVRRSRVAEAQAGLAVVGTASEVFKFDNGVYPANNGQVEDVYYDGLWAEQFPNYQPPNSVNPDADGTIWVSEAIAGNAAYQNDAGTALRCAKALGDNPAYNDAVSGDPTNLLCNGNSVNDGVVTPF